MESELKILSYNIHKGFALSRRFVLSSMRNMIRATEAEIVFLQEVQGDHNGHAKRIENWPGPQFEYLADEVWPHYAYGKNAIYDAGHHGNSILSKYPILAFENIDISNNRFERRSILHATIEWSGSPLHLLCVHLDLTADGRRRQVGRIAERIHSHISDGERLILAGDFNDWRRQVTPIFREQLDLKEVFLERHGRYAKSFPAMFPLLTLDRVYVRGFEPIEAHCHSDPPWSSLSDHCAIETTLRKK